MDLRSLFLVPCLLLATGCGGDNNGNSNDPDESGSAQSEPMTTVDAALMLEDYVTANVTQLRVTSSDAAGNTLSTSLLSRAEAVNFDVATAADKVELGLLTSADQKIGVIVFQPAGDKMTLTLPGDGLTPTEVLNLDIVINADVWDIEPKMLAGGLGFSRAMVKSGVCQHDQAALL